MRCPRSRRVIPPTPAVTYIMGILILVRSWSVHQCWIPSTSKHHANRVVPCSDVSSGSRSSPRLNYHLCTLCSLAGKNVMDSSLCRFQWLPSWDIETLNLVGVDEQLQTNIGKKGVRRQAQRPGVVRTSSRPQLRYLKSATADDGVSE